MNACDYDTLCSGKATDIKGDAEGQVDNVGIDNLGVEYVGNIPDTGYGSVTSESFFVEG